MDKTARCYDQRIAGEEALALTLSVASRGGARDALPAGLRELGVSREEFEGQK